MNKAPYPPYASDYPTPQAQPHAPMGHVQQGYAQQVPNHYPQPMMHPQFVPAPNPSTMGYHSTSMQAPMYDQPHYQAMQAPMKQDMYPHQPTAGQMPPTVEPYSAYDETIELEELRASVRELREVVDHLTQTRSARRRNG